MTLEEQLKQSIIQAVEKLYSQRITVEIDYPTDNSHGDYTTNVAFRLAKQVKKSPMQVASAVAKAMADKESGKLKVFEKIEAVKPGFINFWLSQEYLIQTLQNFSTFQVEKFKGKRIVVEFTDPNPFKEFHIGHLYTNTIGEAICRILEANGAIVWRADYFSDVGIHVAESLWGLEKQFKIQNSKFKSMEELEKTPLSERIQFLGKAYAYGSSAYEENKAVQEEIKIINKLVYITAQKMWQKEKNITPEIDYQKDLSIDQKQLQCIYDLYTTGRTWSLEYFENLYQRLGMKFDGYYPESIAGERGYKLVKEHIQDGIFEKHEGAIIFRGEQFDLHTRVFINSLGLPTYEAKELGLAPWKYEDFPYDESIVVTGNEISEYFKVLIAAMTAINPELGRKTKHLPHGMVRLPEGKMSSRTGKIITGEWLLDEAIKRASNLSKHSLVIEQAQGISASSKLGNAAKRQVMKPSELINSTEQVGVGAVKYAFLKSGIGKDIEFDFETSLSLTGNSGPYIQYAYTRTQSVLRKWEVRSEKIQPLTSHTPLPEELLLLRLIHQFRSKVKLAAEQYGPNIICEYLFNLAKNFNLFYQKYRILDAEKEEEKQFRLLLTTKVGEILKQGLSLLGINTPEKM